MRSSSPKANMHRPKRTPYIATSANTPPSSAGTGSLRVNMSIQGPALVCNLRKGNTKKKMRNDAQAVNGRLKRRRSSRDKCIPIWKKGK
mmetsp:Transcript_29709/g.62009  ORF Transcript_29709/g.62009 Transcript_29709/m.62009 type:complete len:89 (-) Transcript_29709:169-435(-)